jgi:serine/threonine protein kinase
MHPHSAPSAQDPRIGMVLQDRYRIVRKLGDGGMGSVYEGEHVLIKRKVAIKVLHSQFAQNPEIVARFHREAEAATAIGHPNIVEVTDMGRFPDGTAFMVLEFLHGRDWARDIEHQGPQPLGKVVHILSQVCDALSAAHAKGIVHRDLKPENIYLIERAGDPNFAKVLDFGISKIADGAGENRSLTQTGTALGTPYYMAPEQCQGRKDLDARADVYSLGVILFQALTNQYPFDDESYPMLVLKICTEPPPPLHLYRPDLPRQLYEIIGRMLSKDRERRFSGCEEVKAALAPFRHVQDVPVLVADAPSTASRGPAVLEQRASGPVSTPAGTAYLPPQPEYASSPSLQAQAPQRRTSSPVWVVVGFLVVLVVAGGAVGAMAALGVFSRSQPAVASTGAEPAASPAVAPATPVEERPVERAPTPAPAARADAVPTAVAAVPTAPPERATVRIRIDVVGPPAADVTIDGVPFGTAPFEADMPRDPPPAPGQPPRLHTVVVEAEGWATVTQQFSFLVALTREIRMQRASGRGGRSTTRVAEPPRPMTGSGGLGQPQPQPQVQPLRPQRQPIAPVPSPPRGNHGGGLVGSGSVF